MKSLYSELYFTYIKALTFPLRTPVKISLFFLLSLITSTASFGAETDQFTRREEPLEDVAGIITTKANLAIKTSLKNLNSEQKGCQEKDLYKELRKHFANHIKGLLVIDILENDSIAKRNIELNESVFSQWKPWDGIGLGLFLKYKSDVVMSPVLNIGGSLVGTDKLEHMFGQGFHYFKDYYQKDKTVFASIRAGTFREKYVLGGTRLGNGIFSYGDLSANFNGMRFWNHMLQKEPDILGEEHNIGPYIACEKNQWVQVKQMDFDYYIDDSMDESINCSKFATKATARKYLRSVKASGHSCPVDPVKRDEMIEKYKHMSKWIINKGGVEVVRYKKEFKNLN
jgi:hypothetical protein